MESGEVIINQKGGCSFENVTTQSLSYCPNNDTVGGVKMVIYYIPMAQVNITLPTVTNTSTYAERITIGSTGITPVTGKGFKKIVILKDEGELKPTLVGADGNKKMKTDFDCLIPDFVVDNIGFVDTHKNTPLLLVIPDSTGKLWAMPDAMFTKADGTTGKKYEDNSGISGTFSANSKPYLYKGTITVTPDA